MAFVRSYAAAELDPAWQEQRVNNAAAEAPAFAYIEARMAGLPGGLFVDIDHVKSLDPSDTDLLVLPSMRGATPEQIDAIRDLHQRGTALLCFDDCSGLEDLFGVRRLEEGRMIERIEPGTADDILAAMPDEARRRRLHHQDTVYYETDGAREILSGTDSDGRRVAPVMTLRDATDSRPGAVFHALGATRVGRRTQPLDHTFHEGEVSHPRYLHALRAAMRHVSRPRISVEGPATLLAFEQADGQLYAVVMDASFPNPRPNGETAEVRLTVFSETPESVRIRTDAPFLDQAPKPDRRAIHLNLRPDQVVTLEITRP